MSAGVVTQAPLYHSPIGLYGFQAEGIARSYLLDEGSLVVFDTGLGKTHHGMALAALMFEDDLIDHVLVVVEQSKVRDWVRDFGQFTSLEVLKYHGVPPARRAKMREALPQAIVSTYETVKSDVAIFDRSNRRKHPTPGPLLETLAGKRVLVVYDEATKLKSRGTDNHRAHDLLVKTLRKHGRCTVVALTATPVEKGAEDIYNITRITAPSYAPTVDTFEKRYVLFRDEWGNATYKNLSREVLMDPEVPPLDEWLEPIIIRKRKTDPDVVDEFPEQVEEFWSFPLDKDQDEFYGAVLEAFGDDDELDGQLFGLLRQIAAHPLALTRSKGMLARAITQEVGPKGLAAIGSTKSRRLMEFLETLVRGQDDQALVFTFFGPSVIPVLASELTAEGYRVGSYHGQVPTREREEAKERFREGKLDVLLCSDSGARGLNFPDTAYVVQYEMPYTHSLYLQRGNRNHRIDSQRAFVLNLGFVAEGTIEEGIVSTVWDRNETSDNILQDDDAEGAVTASVRRRLLEAEMERRKA